MILDSSAIVAILRSEPEAAEFRRLIEAAEAVSISAATVLEVSLVVGPDRQTLLDRFLAVCEAVDDRQQQQWFMGRSEVGL